ncbi:hypothetical protein Trydic_g5871 [Trypoxylus dichotomus]
MDLFQRRIAPVMRDGRGVECLGEKSDSKLTPRRWRANINHTRQAIGRVSSGACAGQQQAANRPTEATVALVACRSAYRGFNRDPGERLVVTAILSTPASPE